jgi:hypothetical protein
MEHMLFPNLGIDSEIILIINHRLTNQIMVGMIHGPLKCCTNIHQLE